MPLDDEINVSPEISDDFQNFAEFCSENTGREADYLEVVGKNPLEMDAVTIAFSMRHLVRLSRDLLEVLLQSVQDDSMPASLETILATKGIQLDKVHAATLRDVIFAFRDSTDDDSRSVLVRALQIMAISRERRRMVLNLGESYAPPEEGWIGEDFGGDDSMLETVRAIEDPRWVKEEEM
ncbi:MAG: hypothetical protein HY912_01420 [Desulfomonile tiedjei]|uniref:Uncharacterized protein n=1 Tax=Desulfomonile tiedjei TaxID=2358 RepID=A0A9D6Z1Z9_9BACT|nr:hypothetical protein [Desulfomonile tiedjei]